MYKRRKCQMEYVLHIFSILRNLIPLLHDTSRLLWEMHLAQCQQSPVPITHMPKALHILICNDLIQWMFGSQQVTITHFLKGTTV